ncbi:hypothetical protein HGA91_05220 [candidate division WWE3 bacterium]|nr:hypothetical protein [candidate division WWE3 bacterium]
MQEQTNPQPPVNDSAQAPVPGAITDPNTKVKTPQNEKKITKLTLMISGALTLLFILVAFGFAFRSQIFQLLYPLPPAGAWKTEQSVKAECPSNGQITLAISFSNTEPSNDNYSMDVTATDEQTKKSVNLGTVKPGQTVTKTLNLGVNKIAAGRVKFDLKWTNNSSGTDVRYSSYDAIQCEETTPTPTPSTSVTPSVTPTNSVTPTVTPTPTRSTTVTPTPTGSQTTHAECRSGLCVEVAGDGDDMCSSSFDCATTTSTPKPSSTSAPTNTPTPTRTPTPSVIGAPQSTPTPTPTSTPTVRLSATPTPLASVLPESGAVENTIFVLLLSFISLGSGWYLLTKKI